MQSKFCTNSLLCLDPLFKEGFQNNFSLCFCFFYDVMPSHSKLFCFHLCCFVLFGSFSSEILPFKRGKNLFLNWLPSTWKPLTAHRSCKESFYMTGKIKLKTDFSLNLDKHCLARTSQIQCSKAPGLTMLD